MLGLILGVDKRSLYIYILDEARAQHRAVQIGSVNDQMSSEFTCCDTGYLLSSVASPSLVHPEISHGMGDTNYHL